MRSTPIDSLPRSRVLRCLVAGPVGLELFLYLVFGTHHGITRLVQLDVQRYRVALPLP